MIERALITAGIVVVIIGTLGKIGEQAEIVFSDINCALSGNTNCVAISGENSEQGSGNDTRSRRDDDSDL